MLLGLFEIAVFIFSVVLAVNYYKRLWLKGAKNLFVQTILVSFWLLMDIFTYYGIYPEIAHHVRFAAIAALPVLFLRTTAIYADSKAPYKKYRYLFWVVPALTVATTAADNFLNLMWKSVVAVNVGEYTIILTQNGVMFWIHTFYSYLVLFLSFLLLINKYINSTRTLRRQSGFLLFGSAVTWVLNVLFVMQNSNFYPIDPTPISLLIIIFIFYLGLFQTEAQSIVPIARDLIVENMRDMVLALDNADKIVDINPAFHNMLRSLRIDSNCIGKNVNEVLKSNQLIAQQIIYAPGKRSLVLGEGSEARYFELEVSPLFDKDCSVIGKLVMLHDNTEVQQMMKKLESSYSVDQLTGLYNRAIFEGELERADVEENYPISLIVGDVNGLKIANNAFGHATGDMLLQRISRVITQNCRPGDIAARTGGDEFSMILPKTTMKEAMELIAKIKVCCEESDVKPVRLSISWGVAVKTAPEQDIQKVLKDADAGMYKQKLLESMSTHGEIVTSLIQALKESSFETNEHAERMNGLCRELGYALHLNDSQMTDLSLLALLHDLGKVGIPDKVLEKAAPLTEEEWEMMKRHSEIGYHIASASTELSPIAEIILSHHERWDGNGYPRKLKGEEIPYLARVISVVDAFDVMTHDRTYRKGKSVEDAIGELQRCSGTQFDPSIAGVFICLLQGKYLKQVCAGLEVNLGIR